MPILSAVPSLVPVLAVPELDQIRDRIGDYPHPVDLVVGIEWPNMPEAGNVRASCLEWLRAIQGRMPSSSRGVYHLHVYKIDPPTWQNRLFNGTQHRLGTKPLSLMVANDLLGYDTEDNNVADAICIAHYTRSIYEQSLADVARRKRQDRRHHYKSGTGSKKHRRARWIRDTKLHDETPEID